MDKGSKIGERAGESHQTCPTAHPPTPTPKNKALIGWCGTHRPCLHWRDVLRPFPPTPPCSVSEGSRRRTQGVSPPSPGVRRAGLEVNSCEHPRVFLTPGCVLCKPRAQRWPTPGAPERDERRRARGGRRSGAAPLGAHRRPRLQPGRGVAFSGEAASRAPVPRERRVKQRQPGRRRRRSSAAGARAGAPGASRAVPLPVYVLFPHCSPRGLCFPLAFGFLGIITYPL